MVNAQVNGIGPPDLPPRVDRNTKPLHGNRANGQRSATDRLFSPNGVDDIPNYINATPHHQRTQTNTNKQVNIYIQNYKIKYFNTYITLNACFFRYMRCTIVMTVYRHMTVMVYA